MTTTTTTKKKISPGFDSSLYDQTNKTFRFAEKKLIDNNHYDDLTATTKSFFFFAFLLFPSSTSSPNSLKFLVQFLDLIVLLLIILALSYVLKKRTNL